MNKLRMVLQEANWNQMAGMHAQMHQLDITPSQLCLRLPLVVRHRITQDSPLATWRSGPSGVGADASSEIAVVVSWPCAILC